MYNDVVVCVLEGQSRGVLMVGMKILLNIDMSLLINMVIYLMTVIIIIILFLV